MGDDIARFLKAQLDDEAEAARAALQVLTTESEMRGARLGDFATTLLLCVRCAWSKQHLCGALQVGDGAIALLNEDGLTTILGVADHGEHSSETRFLTTPGIENEFAARTRFSIRSGLSAIAVLSDGVSDDFFPEEKRLPEMFAQVLPLVRAQELEAALLKWIGYEKKGSSDDRTLVVSWRGTENPSEGGGENASSDSAA